MKYLYLYENFDNNRILYHGSYEKHNFETHGDIYDGTFFSINMNEAKSYGKYLFEIKLKPSIKIFDIFNDKECNKLMNTFGTLYDNYYDEDDEKYNIETVQQLQETSDSWNPLENTDGVLDWINDEYDGVLMLEGGTKTVLLFAPINEKILYKKLIYER